jgi:hypothetical protein
MGKDAKQRGRPKILTPYVERFIATRVAADQRKPPKERTPRKILADEIQRELIEKRANPPAIGTLEKRISFYSSPKQPFDELWSLASLAEHPLPAEAMPVVLAAYRKTLATLGGSDELTVREAEWIARLYKVIDDPDLVRDWAWLYALAEWSAKVTGQPFITEEFDVELLTNPQYARDEHRNFEREIAIWEIAEKYDADAMKLKDLNLPIAEIEEVARSGKYKREAQDEKGHEERDQEAT